MSDMGLGPRIYKEPLQLNKKKDNTVKKHIQDLDA